LRFAAAFAPSQDRRDRFFSTTPTSLGWAIAPLVAAVDQGEMPGWSYAPTILDPLRVGPLTERVTNAYLQDEAPDVLLVSSTYDSHSEARRIAAGGRAANPDLLVIYGGPHVDEVTVPQVLQKMPQVFPFAEPDCPFDILVAGDGEMILIGLLRLLESSGSRTRLLDLLGSGQADLRSAPGRWRLYTATGGPVPVVAAATAMDLTRLPAMPRKLFGGDMDLYGFSCFYEEEAGQRRLLPSTSTLLHRGCAAHCTFCSERGGYEERSLTQVAAELQMLAGTGYRGVFFDDSTLSDQQMPGVVPALRDAGLRYGSLNRFDKLQDSADVRLLADAGFVYQYCSIEQLDDTVLRGVGKGQAVAQIRQSATLLDDHGISLGVSLLFGLPHETEESVLATLDFVAVLASRGLLSCVSMSLFAFHPNTPATLLGRDGRKVHQRIRFDCPPPNMGSPWSAFEEGQWWHREEVTPEWVEWILQAAEERVAPLLVRNMSKQGVPHDPAAAV